MIAITTLLLAALLFIPFVGFLLLPILLCVLVTVAAISFRMTGTRWSIDGMHHLLPLSFFLTILAIVQGKNVQYCVNVGSAEKGVLGSEIAHCMKYGMYRFMSDGHGWPTVAMRFLILPTAVVVLLFSWVSLYRMLRSKDKKAKNTGPIVVGVGSVMLLIAILLQVY